ncbi:hypothetical protein EV126DRAFT_169983 [Verticillium dahliae]|nr:hypothetical protein EV126DRAFT_169983 [Verticillium dahliae]
MYKAMKMRAPCIFKPRPTWTREPRPEAGIPPTRLARRATPPSHHTTSRPQTPSRYRCCCDRALFFFNLYPILLSPQFQFPSSAESTVAHPRCSITNPGASQLAPSNRSPRHNSPRGTAFADRTPIANRDATIACVGRYPIDQSYPEPFDIAANLPRPSPTLPDPYRYRLLLSSPLVRPLPNPLTIPISKFAWHCDRSQPSRPYPTPFNSCYSTVTNQ